MIPTQFNAIITKLDALQAAVEAITNPVVRLDPQTAPATAPEPSNKLPEAPEGFHPAMIGPLNVHSDMPTFDIALRWDGSWDHTQWTGTLDQIYALRKGSEIAKLNNLE